MHTALVVLTDETADERLLDAAKRYATGTDTELLVCRFIDRKEYQSDARNEARDGKQVKTIEMIEDEAEKEAATVADRVFANADVSYAAIGAAGELPKKIIEVADERGCGHLFVSGRKRSPTGKALFGDIAQAVLLRFDGPVTVTTN
ncbi:universal stress protein [Haloterrigena sp. SYSU A558-1]|uniref:Universal stress protein n=1 Tax=Haloterrigena gelatinilytica TaxID=2741724 RepID=A0A8J8GJT5_9EURY|nr:universal stress protein [Haloterrigena gelatinilytica]NUB90966.1 universal stress protein [Haloterrigena gelatinilytica]NUC73217.1 universal stress protein [Haloterrigena gelatinilytica]